VNLFEDSRHLVGCAFALYLHPYIFHGLAHLFQNGNDIYTAARSQAEEQQFHRAHPLSFAADVGTALYQNGISRRVGAFKPDGLVDAL